jgi:hypothetical protein
MGAAQYARAELQVGSDELSAATEDRLLQQFQPQMMISRHDCSDEPAEFVPAMARPTVAREDGTIYGQVFRRVDARDEVELHFYHLWRRDCGEMGHALDTEHVSVLLREEAPGVWRALYWYAAAHEDTICDASQMTRASTLHAETHGATVWISAGKHASFLDRELCRRGCGGDRCGDEVALKVPKVVSLGSVAAPMHGAVWVRSPEWPLEVKMRRSDFTAARVARVERLAKTDIAWAEPARRPGQAVILGGSSAVNGVAVGGRSADTALVLADDKTGGALETAGVHTRRALGRSLVDVGGAIKSAARRTRDGLGL